MALTIVDLPLTLVPLQQGVGTHKGAAFTRCSRFIKQLANDALKQSEAAGHTEERHCCKEG